ncbi:MAG: hypothetical protein LBP95_05785 [Deltaproteobacteria bacterium]|jgi:tartrate dehydratase alpha subunit/fumarate hydratase class I-like protein|nr:hypothetical protein [Deltaproteobacteria bacterium]
MRPVPAEIIAAEVGDLFLASAFSLPEKALPRPRRALAAGLPDPTDESGPGPAGPGGRASAPGLRVKIRPRRVVALPAAAALDCHCLRAARPVV